MESNEKEVLLISTSASKEDVTDTEDQPDASEQITQQEHRIDSCCAKLLFVGLGILLMFSATVVTVLLPVYMEVLDQRGDAYTAVIFTSSAATVILFLGLLLGKVFRRAKFSFSPPFSFPQLLRCGVLYGGSCLLIMYSLDRKKVACHLQDPIKGVMVVFSFMYYFFFSKTEMSIQKMFCTSTVISGLFISVDFGLCDEFRCRGFERVTKSDDTGIWKWPTHTVWTIIYVVSLALLTLYYTLMEGLLLTHEGNSYVGMSSSRLATVSRLVASRDSRPLLQIAEDSEETLEEGASSARPEVSYRKCGIDTVPLALSISFWTHLISFVFALCFCWSDMIPIIGKASSASEFWNLTTTGFLCHFGRDVGYPLSGNETLLDGGICDDLALYSLLFVFSYVLFSVTSVYFLILSESSVFTMALCVTAMPLANMWWSVFRLTPVNHATKGVVEFWPSPTGELISATLGFPLMLIGVGLYFRAYFVDRVFERLSLNEP